MLWKITEPNGAVTTFQQYDGLGNVLRKTNANNRDTTFAYNSRGYLEMLTTADGSTRYEYDARGEIVKTTYPKGNSVSSSRGQAGVTRISDATGRIDYGYTNRIRISEAVYDAEDVLQMHTTSVRQNRLWRTRWASGDFEEFLHDENGNLTYKKRYAATEPTVPYKTTVQGYDSLNRLTSVSVEGDPYLVSYSYDALGNLSTVTDPVGQTTRYFHDDLGRRGRVISRSPEPPITRTTRPGMFFPAGTILTG